MTTVEITTRALAGKRPANLPVQRVANLPATIDVEPVRQYERRPAVRGGPKLGQVLAGFAGSLAFSGLSGLAVAYGQADTLTAVVSPLSTLLM